MTLETDVVERAVLTWIFILEPMQQARQFRELLQDILLEDLYSTQWNQAHHRSDL